MLLATTLASVLRKLECFAVEQVIGDHKNKFILFSSSSNDNAYFKLI